MRTHNAMVTGLFCPDLTVNKLGKGYILNVVTYR